LSPIKVAVLVDLYLDEQAGGHVKAWQRFAEAALTAPSLLDLTVYFLGDSASTETLGPNVRYRRLPARLGTRMLGLNSGAGHTDLASWHPRLAAELPAHDLVQATSSFAFARTALKLAAAGGPPCLNSLHTDVVRFTRIYAEQMLRGWLPWRWLQSLVVERLAIPARASRQQQRTLDALLAQSPHVFASNPEDLDYAARLVGASHVSLLRRGINHTRFNPALRDRDWLAARFGIPPDRVALLFAGRIDATKRPELVAAVTRELLDAGLPVQLLLAGQGSGLPAIEALLGQHLTAPGLLDQPTLARVMASSDVFVFPSETETIGNVAIEAKASGLPVVVSSLGASRQTVQAPGVDGYCVIGSSVADWRQVIEPLVRDPALRARVSAQARAQVAAAWPDWATVLLQDLLPVWQRHARTVRQPEAGSA
jgi:glycosyltransferase involved in cell wall biosynthesis